MSRIIIMLIFCFLFPLDLQSQWEMTNSPPGIEIYYISVIGNNILAGTGGLGAFLSTDNGLNWNEANVGLTNMNVNVFAINNDIVFAGTGGYGNGGVFLSTNNGLTWTAANNGLPNSTIQALAVKQGKVFAGSEIFGIYLTTNNGSSWTSVNNGLTNHSVFCMEVYEDKIYAGTWGGGIYLSTNNGSNWNCIGLSNTFVDAIAISENLIFVGTTIGGGVYLSTNNGLSWSAINIGLPENTSIHSLGIYGDHVLAGTSVGVFLSSTNNVHWNQVNEGIGNNQIFAIASNTSFIFAGTNGNGIWRRLISEIIGISKINAEIPSRFSLNQNYPNPFNPSTEIKFAVPKSGDIKLVIYDMLGHEIATLVNEHLKPGTYEADWNASQFSSGVYFYKLTAGEFIQTKRMVLVK